MMNFSQLLWENRKSHIPIETTMKSHEKSTCSYGFPIVDHSNPYKSPINPHKSPFSDGFPMVFPWFSQKVHLNSPEPPPHWRSRPACALPGPKSGSPQAGAFWRYPGGVVTPQNAWENHRETGKP